MATLGHRTPQVGHGDFTRPVGGCAARRPRRRPQQQASRRGTVLFTPSEMDAWIKGCKAGEFDDLT
jgi:hypothetical protein